MNDASMPIQALSDAVTSTQLKLEDAVLRSLSSGEPGDLSARTVTNFLAKPRERTFRGKSAVERNAKERGNRRRQRDATALQRLLHCAVCGANVYDERNQLRPDVRERTVGGAWRILACDRHQSIAVGLGWRRARFYEVEVPRD